MFLKSVNILQNYKQERGCLVHFLRLLAVHCSDAQSAEDNHVLCNQSKVRYSELTNVITAGSRERRDVITKCGMLMIYAALDASRVGGVK